MIAIEIEQDEALVEVEGEVIDTTEPPSAASAIEHQDAVGSRTPLEEEATPCSPQPQEDPIDELLEGEAAALDRQATEPDRAIMPAFDEKSRHESVPQGRRRRQPALATAAICRGPQNYQLRDNRW